MSGIYLSEVLQGADAIKALRAEYPDIEFDLSGADLNRRDLCGADLSRADLSRADLTGAGLIESQLRWANLKGTQLNRADLIEADLNGANLNDANLSGADLDGADFTNVQCGGTIFADVDLSTVKGLETIQHSGPSTLSIDTLYRSGGKIPEAFLRGCGVPEEFITYLPSLIGAQQAIQFYSCFISYSHKDEEFAQRLHGRLQQAGLRVWLASKDMKAGQKLHKQIEDAVRIHDKLLLVLSEESIASPWVKTEIRKARNAERAENRFKLFPILLMDYKHLEDWECQDSLSGEDLAEEIRQYYIPGFEHWKDYDIFEAAITRLLKDLRATAESPA